MTKEKRGIDPKAELRVHAYGMDMEGKGNHLLHFDFFHLLGDKKSHFHFQAGLFHSLPTSQFLRTNVFTMVETFTKFGNMFRGFKYMLIR